jgi:DNA helicase II / ATP-dependent DNA helicase PcrA
VQVGQTKPSIRLRNQESKPLAPLENPWTKGLNSQQAAAVCFNHANGAVLVLAGAGSGKTTVLTRRIAQIYSEKSQDLDSKAGSGQILALTFTKDAAQEMSARLKILLGLDSEPKDFPKVETFHAFALGIIRASLAGIPNWQRLGYAQRPVLMDAEVKRSWLAKQRQELALQVTTLDVLEGWLALPFEEDGNGVGIVSNLMAGNGAVSDQVEQSAKIRYEIRSRFRSFLFETGSIDFDDMVSLALRLFRRFPEVLTNFQSHTQFILVDEFQDTSGEQLELVRVLLGTKRNLFLVGDDDQAIYGFRGANPGNIDAALKIFPGMHILKLETNYRSTESIVNYANRIFSNKARHLRKRLVAGRRRERKDDPISDPNPKPNPVRKILHREGPDQARWLADEVIRLHRDEGLAWKDIALLYRINALEPYYRSLIEELIGLEASQEIVLSTVHGAKGLEYPAVFFVGLEDGILPYRKRHETLSPDRLAEERRIFYVGVTRAQRFLYLCSVKKRILRGKQVEAEVSPFLDGKIKSMLRQLSGKG